MKLTPREHTPCKICHIYRCDLMINWLTLKFITSWTSENSFTCLILNQNMFLSRLTLASNFLISCCISIKIGTNSQQIRLKLPTKYFCIMPHSFEIMVHFKVKTSHLIPFRNFFFYISSIFFYMRLLSWYWVSVKLRNNYRRGFIK